MKAMLFLALMAAGSFASAAIQVRCTVSEEGEDFGYSSYVVEKSLAEGAQTGSVDLGPVKDQKVTVNIHNNGTKGFVGSICAEVSYTSSVICSADGAKLEIRTGLDKATVACNVK